MKFLLNSRWMTTQQYQVALPIFFLCLSVFSLLFIVFEWSEESLSRHYHRYPRYPSNASFPGNILRPPFKQPKEIERNAYPIENGIPLFELIKNISTTNTYLHKVHQAPMAMTMIVSDPTSILANLSLLNKYTYAKYQGYSLMVRKPHLKDRNPAWSKMGAILEAFDLGYPLVWMIDLDTLITNMSIPFHRFPEPIVSQLPKASLFISKDCNQFNSGSFLIRNTPWSMYCLNQINLSYTQLHLQQHPWCEQEGLIRYYRMNSTWHHYMIETPDTLFNMYPEESPCLKLRYWQPGDFVLHFAGMMHGVQNLPLFVRKYHETYAMSHSPDVHFHEERYVQQIQQWFHVLY